jgi:RimJ/RimL family protein N-acetyltransferase/anti-anti-sigma regulatory factor
MVSARPDLRPVPRRDADVAIAVGGRLTVGEARGLCTAVRHALESGARAITVDLRDVTATDAVGLAALLQSQRRAAASDVRLVFVPGSRAYDHLVDARLIEELELAPSTAGGVSPAGRVDRAGGRPIIAAAGRVSLGQPDLGDVAAFRAWGGDGFVDQMVGSHLLYRSRHAATDAAVLDAIAHDPRAVTAVVRTVAGDGEPLGLVRLHEVDLVAGFAFLETVVVEPRAMRRGVGIEAARLLVAYGMDALGIRRVEAKVFAYNLLSINALRRNGFRQEGVLREARMYEQQAWDILVFSILHGEMRRERASEGFPSFALFGPDPASGAQERPA